MGYNNDMTPKTNILLPDGRLIVAVGGETDGIYTDGVAYITSDHPGYQSELRFARRYEDLPDDRKGDLQSWYEVPRLPHNEYNPIPKEYLYRRLDELKKLRRQRDQ